LQLQYDNYTTIQMCTPTHYSGLLARACLQTHTHTHSSKQTRTPQLILTNCNIKSLFHNRKGTCKY